MKARTPHPAMAVLENLGLSHIKGITQAHIHLDGADRLPRVELEVEIWNPPAAPRYQLITTELKVQEDRLDLDALCAEALNTVAFWTECTVEYQLAALRRGFQQSWAACGFTPLQRLIVIDHLGLEGEVLR